MVKSLNENFQTICHLRRCDSDLKYNSNCRINPFSDGLVAGNYDDCQKYGNNFVAGVGKCESIKRGSSSPKQDQSNGSPMLEDEVKDLQSPTIFGTNSSPGSITKKLKELIENLQKPSVLRILSLLAIAVLFYPWITKIFNNDKNCSRNHLRSCFKSNPIFYYQFRSFQIMKGSVSDCSNLPENSVFEIGRRANLLKRKRRIRNE